MADEYIAKGFKGGAQTTTLSSPYSINGGTLVVANGTTFPDGTSGPFVVVVDRGLANEEKFLISSTQGTNKVTFNVQQSGYDGTTKAAHSSGATVEHCLDAFTVEQANRYVNLQSARGEIVAHNGTTSVKLQPGTNNTVLIADSTQTPGLKYGQIVAASIASGAVTEAKIDTGAVTESKIATNAVTTTKINNGAVTAEKLSASAIAAVLPVGMIAPFAGSSAPSGWALCNGASVSRTDPIYAALFAVIQTTYGSTSGTTFNLPNLTGKVPVGRVDNDPETNSELNFGTLGSQKGAKTITLQSSEMPVHSHGPGASVDANGNADNRTTNRFITAQTQGAAEGWALSSTATLGARASATTATAGGTNGTTQGHNNIQPSLVINYIIKL